MRIKKITYMFFIIIFLTICILNGLATNNQVYAVRSVANDLSNLVNYPSTYTLVRELQVAHPKWNFTILYTGLDWNTVIYNETLAAHGRSLLQTSIMSGNENDWVCSVCGWTPYDNGSWYCASEKAVKYYMDPRNWLNENYIFTMESLRYDATIQNIEGVKEILSGTFMDTDKITYVDTNGNTRTINKSYAQIFMEAGETYNVSPYALASRVRQEQGTSGTSALISGTYTSADGESFVGYYNYFNIGAGGNTEAEIIKNGLTYAKDSRRNWTSPELAIYGGAKFYASYVNDYQDSGYLQKYQVDPSGDNLYIYQYMQNISAPYSEGVSVRNAYISMGLLESNFNFIIPVYENMPDLASPIPGVEATTPTVTDGNVIVTTKNFPLTIRSGPGTSYSPAGYAPIGSVLTRIEKAQSADSSGIYWDKVEYTAGNVTITGYATREYLSELNPETEVGNIAMVTTEMCNLRTAQGTTGSKVIQVLKQGTEVTAISKSNSATDGHMWYRVKLADGTQGYVSEAFLKEENTTKYEIDGEYIKIVPGTKISDIPGATLTGSKMATGEKVTIEGTAYTLIMLGDVNGDGEVDARDSARILRYSIGQFDMTDIQQKAADVNKDSEIDARDSARILRASVNLFTITL